MTSGEESTPTTFVGRFFADTSSAMAIVESSSVPKKPTRSGCACRMPCALSRDFAGSDSPFCTSTTCSSGAFLARYSLKPSRRAAAVPTSPWAMIATLPLPPVRATSFSAA